MLHSGVTELIWHFAGYLHLTDEVARARELYEDMNAAQAASEYEPGSPVEDQDIDDLDELGSGRGDVHWPVFDQAVHLSAANELRNVAGDVQPADFALGSISRFSPGAERGFPDRHDRRRPGHQPQAPGRRRRDQCRRRSDQFFSATTTVLA
ncbi:hypothetical protein QW131_30510 [Roseibium salinum]|nr:hypothetical protein [Roseibium salinum]